MKKSVAQHIEQCKAETLLIHEKRENVLASLHKLDEIVDIERSIKMISAEIKSAKEVTEASRRRYSELEPRVEPQTEYRAHLEKEVAGEETELGRVRSELEPIQLKIKKIDEKTAIIEGIKKSVAQLEQETAPIHSEIADLERETEMLTGETLNMEAGIKRDAQSVNTLQDEIHTLNMVMDELADKIRKAGDPGEWKRRVTGLRRDNRETKEKIIEMRESIDSARQFRERVAPEIAGLREETGEAVSVVERLRGKADSLRESVMSRQEAEALQGRLDGSVKERDEIAEKTERLEKHLNNHMKTKGGIIKEVGETTGELESAVEEYEKLMERVAPYKNDPALLQTVENKIPGIEATREEQAKQAQLSGEQLKHLNNALDMMKTECSGYREAMGQISEMLNH